MTSTPNERLTGRCWIMHAFDVGDAISLKRCRELVSEASIQQAAPSRRAPSDFGLDPQPIIWESADIHLRLQGRECPARSRALIYDFGVISVSFSFEMSVTLPELHQISVELSDYEKFMTMAREHLKTLTGKIHEAITDARLSSLFENYIVFQFDPKVELNLPTWLESNKQQIAQILRGETSELGPEEREESLRYRISYTNNDLVVIDWAAALIIDRNYDDTLAVLEFANSELLELRLLDDRLDRAMDESYQLNRQRVHWWQVWRHYDKPVRRIAEMMAEAAAEFEAVDNAIKLTNDQFLARVYRLATDRFHLSAFDRDINRKIDTLWEIHQFFIDRSTNQLMVVLEWIIIVLITLELFPFFR